MKYTNKQIRQILTIQDFLETTKLLSKIYESYDNKELNKNNMEEKQRIFKLFCSSLSNLTDAIKKSSEIFMYSQDYNSFDDFINQKYKANNNKYYNKTNFESDLYKILKEIRNQNNHFEKEDNDNIILFEISIDYNLNLNTFEKLKTP